jgi:hypothetical protein
MTKNLTSVRIITSRTFCQKRSLNAVADQNSWSLAPTTVPVMLPIDRRHL